MLSEVSMGHKGSYIICAIQVFCWRGLFFRILVGVLDVNGACGISIPLMYPNLLNLIPISAILWRICNQCLWCWLLLLEESLGEDWIFIWLYILYFHHKIDCGHIHELLTVGYNFLRVASNLPEASSSVRRSCSGSSPPSWNLLVGQLVRDFPVSALGLQYCI